MSKRRKSISLTTKLAACLAELQCARGAPFTRDELRGMTAAQMLSLFQWDHSTLHAIGGSDEYWNLTPYLILDHRAKTKNDRRELRKNKRAGKAHKGHLTRMAERLMAVEVRGHIDSRGLLPVDVRGHKADTPARRQPMPGSKASPWRKRMNGTVERRK